MAKTKRDTLEQEKGQPLPLPQSMGLRSENARAWFADAYVLPDGTVHEYGGEFRSWASVEDFHKARGWRSGALFFPARLEASEAG